MSKGVLAVLATLGVLAFFAGVLIFGYISFTNDANRFEIGIKAQYNDNRNVYDNGWKKVVEVAKVPEKYTAKLKELYDGTMKGRYGANGSQAMMQWIQEQNPTIDPTLYRQLQQTIEGFRDRFQQSQTELIAKKQQYETFLYATIDGRFYNLIGGYPHIDMSKFDIITSEKTERDFETKKSDPLDF